MLNVRRLISLSFSSSTALVATVDALIDDVLGSIRFVRLVRFAIDDASSTRTVAVVLEMLPANVDKPSDRALDTELAMLLGRLDAVLPVAALDSVMRSESTLDTLPGRLARLLKLPKLARLLKSTFKCGLPFISGRFASVVPTVIRSGKRIVLLCLKKLL